MVLERVLVTGDAHGRVEDRLRSIRDNMPEYEPEKTAVIILGDAGINYHLNGIDHTHKKQISRYGYTVYCLRGNHEARPSDIPSMKLVRDDFTDGAVWIEEEFPLIRYFCDWGVYKFLGRKILCLGGAYSVDKNYRLMNGWTWFENEQLTTCEMDECYRSVKNEEFNFVLSHTCPYSWQPTDLFLGFIDQSTVDNTMERWMDILRQDIRWGVWLFGHYHADRVELPHVEMFYTEVEDLEDIESRWRKYDETGDLDWWIPVSPKFEKVNN